MTEIKAHVEFEPVETKTGAEWQVRATLPSGKQLNLGSFDTEAEAREWIARKSSAWLQLKACEASQSG
jgi:plasmid replication initiation protein